MRRFPGGWPQACAANAEIDPAIGELVEVLQIEGDPLGAQRDEVLEPARVLFVEEQDAAQRGLVLCLCLGRALARAVSQLGHADARSREPRDGAARQLAGAGCVCVSLGHGLPSAGPCRVQ